jgi:PAS domain S-box-containing protein
MSETKITYEESELRNKILEEEIQKLKAELMLSEKKENARDLSKKEINELTKTVSEFQRLLLESESVQYIFQLAADKIREMLGSGIAIISQTFEETQTRKIVAYSGLNVTLEKLNSMLGFDPQKYAFSLREVSPEMLKKFRLGKLEIAEGGIYEMLTRKVPKPICDTIEKMFDIDTVYAMGFVKNNKHFGVFTILTRENIDFYKTTIEPMVNSASVAIQKRMTEEAFQLSEEKFRLLVENMNDLVCELDESGAFKYINNQYFETLGYQPYDLLNKLALDIIHPDDIVESVKTLENLKYKSEKSNQIWKFKHKKGEYRQLECKGNIFINSKSEKRIVLISRDITAHKNIENQLQTAKENAEKSNNLKTNFINNISHEIRTPMNGIFGFAELLSKSDLTPEKQNKYINIITESCSRLLKVIDNVIDISGFETSKIEISEQEIVLEELISKVILNSEQKAKVKNIRLAFIKKFSDKEIYIKTNENILMKITENIIETLINYTNEGTIELGYNIVSEIPELFVRSWGKRVLTDKQIDFLNHYTSENREKDKLLETLGLSLSVAAENAVLLGGNIRTESNNENELIFTIKIPTKPTNFINQKTGNTEKSNTISENFQILIAEDEDVNFYYMQELFYFLKIKQTVFRAKNGLEAVEICRKNPNINLVLLDIKMPEFDGFEAAVQIKKFRPDLPIIAVTAYNTHADESRAIASGFSDYITKPIPVEIMKFILNKYQKAQIT